MTASTNKNKDIAMYPFISFTYIVAGNPLLNSYHGMPDRKA
jgi:hypothetical protein